MTNDFSETYDLYHTAIFRYCLQKCRDTALSEDLTQETFLRFWLCMQRNEEILLARAFLYRIAHNLFIDHVRKKKTDSLDELLETGFEPTDDSWHQTYSHLDARRPLQKLRGMEKPYRQALHSRYLQGLSPAEIAHITGESPNVVSVRIFRGLKHLRFLLDDGPVPTRKSPRLTTA